jgi:excisionase family DNA binding protein
VADRLLTAEDVAELIGMRTDYVYRLARRDAIPHLRFGRTVRFRSESIEEWLEEEEQAVKQEGHDRSLRRATTARHR